MKPVKSKSKSIVGVDVDKKGNPLRPTQPVLYWSGEGQDRLRCWPAWLVSKNTDGSWNLSYLQRHHLSHTMTAAYSDKPSLHKWTFVEAYDDFTGR